MTVRICRIHVNLETRLPLAVYPPQTPPTLVGPSISGTFVNFYCEVYYAGTADLSGEARFDVTFLFDGIADSDTLVTEVKSGNRALLNEIHLQGQLGKEVHFDIVIVMTHTVT